MIDDQQQTKAKVATTLCALILIGLTGLACHRQDSYEPTPMPRFIDLLRIAQEQSLPKGKKRPIQTWSLDGDARALLFQHPPGRIVLGPIPPGDSCVLRFGMGLRETVLTKSDGVEFSASMRRGESEQLLFREFLDPKIEGNHRWVDREVSIPAGQGDAFSIVLETATGPTRAFDHSGWGTPHVVCESMSNPPNGSGRPNVILISIDTLRPDHLGFYGYPRSTSPTLDALAQESLVFDDAFAPAPHTLPSHASMFTGLFPFEHGAGHRFPEAPLAEEAQTVAETLRDAGYRTVGFSAGGMMSGRYGLSQGFEEWTERQPASLESMMPAVFDALDRAGSQPLFLFLHTYDVHGPYEQPVHERFFKAAADAPRISPEDWAAILQWRAHTYQKFGRFPGLPDVLASYDSGIRFVDSQLALLFEQLRAAGGFEDSLIIVTSDHGESMFEHGRYISHAYSLSDQEVRIPLLVKLPHSRETGRRDGFVQLVDILPMILDEVGVESRAVLAGRNPVVEAKGADQDDNRWVRGEASHTGARYIRTSDWKIISATTGAWEIKKKIFGPGADRFETGWQIFDLSKDPGESDNLFGRKTDFPPQVRQLISTLRSFETPGRDIGEETVPQGEHAEALRALGYIE